MRGEMTGGKERKGEGDEEKEREDITDDVPKRIASKRADTERYERKMGEREGGLATESSQGRGGDESRKT